MKNKKAFRLLAVLMGCLLTVSFLGNGIVQAALPPTYECGNFIYEEAYGGAEIVDIINPTETVTIPATLDGKPVAYVTTQGKDNIVSRFEVEEDNLYLKAVDGVLYNRTVTQLIRVPGGYQGTLTIPQGVVTIAESGAYGCQQITKILFPNSLRLINDFAFKGCTGITDIALPKDLRSLRLRAFEGCTALASISLPDGVGGVDQYTFIDTAFYNNENNRDQGVLYLGSYLVDGGRFEGTNYTVRQGTKTIADNAFEYKRNLTVTLPESVEFIGTGAFETLSPSNVVFPNKGVSTGLCFGYSTNAITANKHILSTKNLQVENQTLTLPQGTLSIAQESLENDTPFTIVYIPASVEKISLYPYNVDSVIFKDYAIDPNNPYYTVVDGVLYTKDMKTLVSCPPGKEVVTVPEGVLYIADDAFYQNHELTKVTFSSTVKEIGVMAFASCWELKEVELPKDLTYIWVTSNQDAFYQCGDLQRLTIPVNANPFPVHMAKDGILEIPAETQYIKHNYTLRRCIMQVTEPSFALDYAKCYGYSYKIAGSNQPTVTNTDVPTPTDVPLGDVNTDGFADAKDALAVLKYAVQKTDLTDRQKTAAEVVGDEKIDAKDALEILKYSVKKITKFPIEIKYK